MHFGVRSRNLSNVGQSLDRWPKIYHLEILSASKGTLRRWFQLHLQSLASTNLNWAYVVGYGPYFLCVIHMEGLCLSRGNINRLMMMSSKVIIILISLLMSPLLGHRPSIWITHKEKVSTHQPSLDGGLWPVLLMCTTKKIIIVDISLLCIYANSF
jgi:hypothetical protein